MRWRVEAGEVDVLVGASSEDLRLSDSLCIGIGIGIGIGTGTGAAIDGARRAFYAD